MRAFRGSRDLRSAPSYQLHHVLPVAVFSGAEFGRAFSLLRADGFDPRSFQLNGLLLPATEEAALEVGRPLHRGPHRLYNALVRERVASIVREMDILQQSRSARVDAAQRLVILIGALKRCLSGDHSWICLNRRDPMNSNAVFSDLDSAIDQLWFATK